jgi:hypothetical protein
MAGAAVVSKKRRNASEEEEEDIVPEFKNEQEHAEMTARLEKLSLQFSSGKLRSLTRAENVSAGENIRMPRDCPDEPGENTFNSIDATHASSIKRVSSMLAGQNSTNKPFSLNLEDCARIIQKKCRERLHKRRLHCKNLADRLIFESDLMIGTARLFKQILVFGLLIGALNISSNEQVKRGIYIDLDNSFDFSSLQAVTSRDEFISTWIPAISASSKKYFIRSSTYFDSGGAGSVELHTGTVLFSEAKLLGGLELSVQLPCFSFTAWVQMVPEFVQGYVFRKRLQPAGSGSELSCWGAVPPFHTLTAPLGFSRYRRIGAARVSSALTSQTSPLLSLHLLPPIQHLPSRPSISV